MSVFRNGITRRGLGGGLAALGVLAAGGAALRFGHFFAKRYPPTPYDDLLGQLVDREPAARLGAAVRRVLPGWNAAKIAAQLRRPGATLAARAASDAAEHRFIEAGGWILPESVALYAALSAAV